LIDFTSEFGSPIELREVIIKNPILEVSTVYINLTHSLSNNFDFKKEDALNFYQT